MEAHLEIRLLGGLQILQDQTTLTNFMSNKVPALLAYLAVTQRPHQRDTLATLLWGEMPDTDAKNNLRQALSNLRKFIEPYLIITRDTVEFNAALPHTLDSAEFLSALHYPPDLPATAQIERLQFATSLYQGDFLAGFLVRQVPDYEEWALAQRVRFHELALQTLHTLTNHYLNSGEYRAAIESARRLLTLDAWREEAHYQLMLALVRSDQRAAALQQYETCRRLLETEMGVEPSEELTAFAGRIRTALQKSRLLVPTATSPFVGRVAELAIVRHRLADPACRLLTLTGPGGMGKTQLAVEAATAMQTRFLNGACFVPLAGVYPERPDGVLFALIDALHLTLTGSVSPQTQLYTALSRQEMLIVLDNVEHLVEQVGWLGDLLREAPEIKILATSRERLDLRGEWVMELDSFPIPPGADLLTVQTGAGELFISNAQRIRADFEVTADNAEPIRTICQLVGGLPLAISLAAASLHTLTCADIATELANTLDFLKSTHRDMPPRQRTLRAVFEQSWRRLSPREKHAFAALSIFRGSFGRRTAYTITDVTPDILASLVAKSLLRRQQKGRYELHPVLQAYADEQIEQEHRYPLQARHAAYFAEWLATQESHLNTPREGEIFHAIRADHANVQAYWSWSLLHQQIPLLAQGLTTLRHFYSEQGRYREGMEWMEKTAILLAPLVAHGMDDDARHLLGKVLARWATFCLWGGELHRAESLFQEALSIARHGDDPAEVGFVLLNQGYFTVLSGEYPSAEGQFLESLHQYRSAKEGHGIARALSALGALGNVTGEWERARDYLEESVAISRQIEDENGLRSSLTNLGNVFYLNGDSSRARNCYVEVLPLCQKVGDRSAEAVIWSNLGSLSQEQGDLAEAETLFKSGLEIFRELNSWQYVIHGTTALAGVHVAQGQYEQARRELVWALQKAIAEHLPHIAPLAVYEAAILYHSVGHYNEALTLFYWVLENPAALAEQKQGTAKRLPILEAEMDTTQKIKTQAVATRLSAEAILGYLQTIRVV